MAYITSKNLDIYYEVAGLEGSVHPPMVFAHGMGGNAAIWFNQMSYFGQTHKVVAFDHRYFGRSACPQAQFEPASFVDDALAILDANNIERAIWVCQSMGGWTGSQLAVHHPDRVAALVMSHTPGIFEHPNAVNDLARLAKTIESGFLPALAEDFPVKNPVMANLYGAINRFNDIENAAISRKIGEARLGVDVRELKDYETPTLFVTGEKDVLFEAAYIKALSEQLPKAQFANLGDVGHSSYFELPDAFNQVVKTFLTDQGLI